MKLFESERQLRKLITMAIIFFLIFLPSGSLAGDTNITSFTVIENNLPIWRNQNSSITTQVVGESVTLYAQLKDDTGLETAILSTNETGDWKNWTMTHDSPIDMKDFIVNFRRNASWDSPIIGAWTAPAMGDLDNDGDYDMLIGEYDTSQILFYENIGSSTSPSWTQKAEWNVVFFTQGPKWPALADMDSDGDYDLMVGSTDGGIHGYENIGNLTSPEWTMNNQWDVNNGQSLDWIRPYLSDLDHDGDFDLSTYSYRGGGYVFYENIGNLTSPNWTIRVDWIINNIPPSDNSRTALADLDNDSDFDMLIGAWDGVSSGYENTGNVTSPVWTKRSGWDAPSIQFYAANPYFTDIDNDGDYDLMIGDTSADWSVKYFAHTRDGKVSGYENVGIPSNGWMWANFTWQNSSVPSNTTVAWRIWFKDTSGNWNSTDIMTFTVKKKDPVWTDQAEFMVSPSGWPKTSPEDYRIVNITAGPLDTNGHYLGGLSNIEAEIYDTTNQSMGIVNLIGNGPYSGNFTIPDGIAEGTYTIRLKSFDLTGVFRVLNWGCVKCHNPNGWEGSGWFYHGNHPNRDVLPSTFDPGIVHNHNINPGSCTGSCHYDPPRKRCTNCHGPQLDCQDCHRGNQSSDSLLSVKYGTDVHGTNESINCKSCHGTLPNVNRSVDCTICHPLNGSNITTVPGSMEIMSHSINKTVACSQCHNPEHDIKSMIMDAAECKNCHSGIAHNNGAKCTNCHGSDPHNVTLAGGTECIACHVPDDVNISKFARHANVNESDGKGYITNNDCWTCHYNKDMNRNNVYLCEDCHLNSTGIVPVNTSLIKNDLMHGGMTTCKGCHGPTTTGYHQNGTVGPLGLVEKILRKFS